MTALPGRCPWAVLLAVLLGSTVAGAQARPSLRIVFTEDLFIDIRSSDAVAAVAVWVNELARIGKVDEAFSSGVAPSADAVPRMVDAGQADVVAFRTTDFLRLRRRTGLLPFVVFGAGALGEGRGLLLVGPQSPVSSIDELKGRDLLVVGTPSGVMARLWLETQVMKRGYPTLESFFGEVRVVAKPSQAVLPVFFGQAAAGLVDDASLRLIGELNPQIARQVKELAASPPLLAAVVAVRGDLAPARREKLLTALESLVDTPRGQQLLALFKSNGAARYDPAVLRRTEALVAEHDALAAALARRAAPGPRSTR